jgi:hypothetical protein
MKLHKWMKFLQPAILAVGAWWLARKVKKGEVKVDPD